MHKYVTSSYCCAIMKVIHTATFIHKLVQTKCVHLPITFNLIQFQSCRVGSQADLWYGQLSERVGSVWEMQYLAVMSEGTPGVCVCVSILKRACRHVNGQNIKCIEVM